MFYNVTILGGGASGLTAAIKLAQKGYKVCVLESKERIGQKILVTGNGRCNLTNLDISRSNYHSEDLDVVESVIKQYGCADVLEFFGSIGLFTRSKDNLVYPLSNKASSVVDLLRAAVGKYDVNVITEFEIKDVRKGEACESEACEGEACEGDMRRFSDVGRYVVESVHGEFILTENLIVATGLKAHGGTDIGLKILRKFGHKIVEPYPALVQLRSGDSFLKGLKGVKFVGEIKVRRGEGRGMIGDESRGIIRNESGSVIGGIIKDRRGDILRVERGEVLITDYGLSGIAIMQLSYLFSLYNNCTLEIDFLPDMSIDELEMNLIYLEKFYKKSSIDSCNNFSRDSSNNPYENSIGSPDSFMITGEHLTGFMDKKLGMRIIKSLTQTSHPTPHTKQENYKLTPHTKQENYKLTPRIIANYIKAMPINISGNNGFKNAQVCGGGATLSDFNETTLESHHSKGLFATGEVLDAVGDCGGYNLHWAFASALCVSEGFS